MSYDKPFMFSDRRVFSVEKVAAIGTRVAETDTVVPITTARVESLIVALAFDPAVQQDVPEVLLALLNTSRSALGDNTVHQCTALQYSTAVYNRALR